MIDFKEFPKIARLSRQCTITEKIDGTNASVFIRPAPPADPYAQFEFGVDIQVEVQGAPHYMRAGSRTQWLSYAEKNKDNYGFAAWVHAHAPELAALGPGLHFGEWWGQGIQRKYGLTEKRWSLFNTHRWSDPLVRPACCHVVPVLYQGVFSSEAVDEALLTLARDGSKAAPDFHGRAEGVVIWHEAARVLFKKTLDKDDEWKGKSADAHP